VRAWRPSSAAISVLIAESDLNDPRVIRARVEAGGYGLDAQWSDDFHHALHAVLTGERNGYYADFGGSATWPKRSSSRFVYAGRESQFRRRSHGRPPTELPGHRFLGYMHNHDQIGNRARRAEQIADPTDVETFRRSKIEWSELDDPEHARVLDWYRRLIRLRRETLDLTDGRLELVVTRCDEARRWLAVERGAVSVLCNLGKDPAELPLGAERARHLLLATSGEVQIGEKVRLPPRSVAILGESPPR
jgi:1,4-alpha-glucan branching enzyme